MMSRKVGVPSSRRIGVGYKLVKTCPRDNGETVIHGNISLKGELPFKLDSVLKAEDVPITSRHRGVNTGNLLNVSILKKVVDGLPLVYEVNDVIGIMFSSVRLLLWFFLMPPE